MRTSTSGCNVFQINYLSSFHLSFFRYNENFTFDFYADTKYADNKLSDNKLDNKKLSDNNLVRELVGNRSFLNQSQLRKL